jgi:hypothetical protein
MRKLAEYREAERLLRPYIDSPDPKLSGNARLLCEMGTIYTDWYIQDSQAPDAEQLSKNAEACFVRAIAVNPQHAETWIKRAELYAVAGTRAKRPDTLTDARKWLSNAREILKTDTPEIKHVEELLTQPKP